MRSYDPDEIIQLIRSIFSTSRIKEAATTSYFYAHNHVVVIGLIGAVTHPLFYFFWKFFNPAEYDSLILRLIGSTLCLPSIFMRKLEARNRQSLAMFSWFTAIGYNLPFFFCYMLLENANVAHNTEISTNFYSWPMQYAIALMLLVMLVVDGLMVSIIFLLSTLAAWTLFLLTNENINYASISDVYFVFLPTFLFILVTGTIFNRNREIIQQEKLAAMASIGSNIAHELRTPLLGIKGTTRGLKSHLPALVNGYDLAMEHGLDVQPVRQRHLNLIRKSLEHIESETDQSNIVIDMLLINSATNPLQGLEFEKFGVADCMKEALDRYPFDDEQQGNLIILKVDQDFILEAPRILIIHVMFNLIKNALYYVRKANKGEVYITTQYRNGAGRITVEDTGTGIASQDIPHIFDRFYTTTETGSGSGIGLAFCKLVMEGLNGEIICSSEVSKYTRFTLKFKS